MPTSWNVRGGSSLAEAEIARYLERADEALDASRALQASGYPIDAVSRAYYAMFYAAHAALLAKRVTVSKHQAVIAEFGRHYAKTGELDRSLHRTLIDAFDERQQADYDVFLTLDAEQVSERIAEAGQFIEAVRSRLREDGDV